MQYLNINRHSLYLSLEGARKPACFSAPVKLKDCSADMSALQSVVYEEILYRARYAEDRRRGIRKKYKLCEPDPWLVGIAFIMWQGIMQGLAWDAVKVLVGHAIGLMRTHRIAPGDPLTLAARRTRKASTLELGFHWTEYASDGRKQYHMFLGLRRIARHLDVQAKTQVSSSLVAEREKRGSRNA